MFKCWFKLDLGGLIVGIGQVWSSGDVDGKTCMWDGKAAVGGT